MSAEESKAVVQRFNQLFGECWRTGDVGIFDEVLAPDFVYHSPEAPPDLAGFKQSLLMLSAGLHDLSYTVEDLFAEGDKVADRLTWQATHQGELNRLRTTPEALRRRFCSERSLRVAIEAGTHLPWVSRLLKECGHEVLVANPRKVRLVYANKYKTAMR